MSFDRKTLYELLPVIYRIRDAEQGHALEAVLSVIAEQVAVIEESLAQLYDDQFIETCGDWVVPYIGDLIGYRALYGVTPRISSPRAEVANTIGYRRRKGTVVMLEQLARDVTGFPAHVVEFFQLLATTQYMKHLRPANLSSPDLRQWESLERLNTPFDTIAHTAEVRHISNKRGRYNIPNIGIFLWRLGAYPLTRAPAFKVDDRRYMFSPLGNNLPLFGAGRLEKEFTALSVPLDIPMPISRRMMDSELARREEDDDLANYYPRSILLQVDGKDVLPDPHQPLQKLADLIEVCNLSDLTDASNNVIGWSHMPQDKIAIDPVLGRIAFPANQDAPGSVHLTFHYGFSAEMGGGEYERGDTLPTASQAIRVPDQEASIEKALEEGDSNEPKGERTVEITDSGRYPWPPSMDAKNGIQLEVRASNGHRPLIAPDAPDAIEEFVISGDEHSTIILNGLLVSGYTLRVKGSVKRFRLLHCTLVPGLRLARDGTPLFPPPPSLIVESKNTEVDIDHCIIGTIRIANDTVKVHITNSIVDATAKEGVAYAGPVSDELSAGGPLRIEQSTVIGKVHAASMELISNSILLARFSTNDDPWKPLLAPIVSDRRQEGCVRFSFLPFNSRVPRRYSCQPATQEDEARVRPQFTSLRYGDPGYGQLSQRNSLDILQGAENELEMGGFYELSLPQREANLRIRLDEYLRFGLEAGIFYAT